MTTTAEPGSESGYSGIQASRLTGCSISQLRYWDRVDLVRPSGGEPPARRYSFRDLVILRMVRDLLDAGLSLQRIRKAAQYLQESGDELAQLRLVSDGTTVLACRSDGEVLDALRVGQLALFVSVDEVARTVETEVAQFTAEREAFVGELEDPANPSSAPDEHGQDPAHDRRASP